MTRRVLRSMRKTDDIIDRNGTKTDNGIFVPPTNHVTAGSVTSGYGNRIVPVRTSFTINSSPFANVPPRNDDITEEEYIQIALMMAQEEHEKELSAIGDADKNNSERDPSTKDPNRKVIDMSGMKTEDVKIVDGIYMIADDRENFKESEPSDEESIDINEGECDDSQGENSKNEEEEDSDENTEQLSEEIPSPDGPNTSDDDEILSNARKIDNLYEKYQLENITPIRLGDHFDDNKSIQRKLEIEHDVEDLLRDIPGVEYAGPSHIGPSSISSTHNIASVQNNPLGIQMKSALNLALDEREEIVDLEYLREQNANLEKHKIEQSPAQKVDRLHAIRMIRSHHLTDKDGKNYQTESSTSVTPLNNITVENPVKTTDIPMMSLPFVSKAFIYYAHLYKHTTNTTTDCLFLFQWLGHTLNISGSLDIPLEILRSEKGTSNIRIVFLSKYGLTYEVQNDYTQKMLSYKVCNVSLMKKYIVSMSYKGKIIQYLASINFDPVSVEYYLECNLDTLEWGISDSDMNSKGKEEIDDVKPDNKGKAYNKGKEEHDTANANIKKMSVFFNGSILLEIDMNWEFQ